ncbi:unnamed protein product [Cuscuta epithymum]|uniref:Uncharacterized protein n=1 Tax=Cuscuta epithymum TaxID=186058 RepID=A0AAV0CD04_9ASTE|nr:unnamed protein product [Cuscuta epithymum]
MSSKKRATGYDDRQLTASDVTMQKKKARRVSFAETASVRFFDRDEEEIPPESISEVGERNGFEVNELNFHQLDNLKTCDNGEAGNASGDDEEGETTMRTSSLMPMESSSPTFGSATSNNDHFFGPVSPSFIRPGRLSDLAISDDNHEKTMDSTAISMHSCSLARSEAGLDLKTPPGIHLSAEEKTEENTPASTQGNSMVLTVTKKQILNSSFSVVKASATSISSDMSLIGDHSKKYDYGRLSPDLDALLRGGQHQVHIRSLLDNISASTSPTNWKLDYLASKEDASGIKGFDESCKQDAGAAFFHNMPSDSGIYHATHNSSASISSNPDCISVDYGPSLSNESSKEELVVKSMVVSIDALQVKSKFTESANKLAPLQTKKLNVYGIEMLQDSISRMLKSKKYELFFQGLLSQKNSAYQNLREQRAAEVKLLMCRVAHEKAKMHLMLLKKDKLLEKFHSVSSGVQECISLKLNSLPLLSAKSAKGYQLGASLQTSIVNRKEMTEAARDKVSTLVQALEDSNMKITNLIRYFNTSLKMKAELNCNDTVALVKEYMVKRRHCRFFHEEMQMFDIQDTWNSPGHHIVVLKYLGILVQSLKIVTGSTSSITISNELNDATITKKFRNMDARTAFSFVLKSEISRKFFGARSLTQEIQVTRSLLGNLVDVIKEVQLARSELHNLIDTLFCSPKDEELDLHLNFISFKSGIKVKVTLGLSFLNRGTYPSETIPYVWATRANGIKCDESVVGGIEDAIKSVKPGYLRIVRLCRRISKAILSSGL